MNTARLDLRPAHLGIVRTILAERVPGREVWVFGSRARGDAKPFSDLDLAVIGDEPLSLDAASRLGEAFSDSDLPFKVDVVDWARTSDVFRKIIERDHVVLRSADEAR